MKNYPTYASVATTRRAISAVEKAGYQVSSVRCLPCGTIEITIAGMRTTSTPANDFDQLEAAGLL